MDSTTPTRYRFSSQERRVTIITSTAAFLVVVCSLLVFLPGLNIGPVVIVAYGLGAIALVVLLPMLWVQYSYLKAGVWFGPAGTRVQYPGEDEQQMSWEDALFATNEGDEYLRQSKGREGLGHIFAETRYIRLHLEGMTPQQREAVEQVIAEYSEIRRPRGFTLITLFTPQGEKIARGRLYLFADRLLCAENRGKKRVFFDAALKDLKGLKPEDPFHIGKLECDAFSVQYKNKTYVIMLGYETTISTNLGSSSRWSLTGNAEEWIAALNKVEVR